MGRIQKYRGPAKKKRRTRKVFQESDVGSQELGQPKNETQEDEVEKEEELKIEIFSFKDKAEEKIKEMVRELKFWSTARQMAFAECYGLTENRVLQMVQDARKAEREEMGVTVTEYIKTFGQKSVTDTFVTGQDPRFVVQPDVLNTEKGNMPAAQVQISNGQGQNLVKTRLGSMTMKDALEVLDEMIPKVRQLERYSMYEDWEHLEKAYAEHPLRSLSFYKTVKDKTALTEFQIDHWMNIRKCLKPLPPFSTDIQLKRALLFFENNVPECHIPVLSAWIGLPEDECKAKFASAQIDARKLITLSKKVTEAVNGSTTSNSNTKTAEYLLSSASEPSSSSSAMALPKNHSGDRNALEKVATIQRKRLLSISDKMDDDSRPPKQRPSDQCAVQLVSSSDSARSVTNKKGFDEELSDGEKVNSGAGEVRCVQPKAGEKNHVQKEAEKEDPTIGEVSQQVLKTDGNEPEPMFVFANDLRYLHLNLMIPSDHNWEKGVMNLYELLSRVQRFLPKAQHLPGGAHLVLEEVYSVRKYIEDINVEKLCELMEMDREAIDTWFAKRRELDKISGIQICNQSLPFAKVEKAWLWFGDELIEEEQILKNVAIWSGVEKETIKDLVSKFESGAPLVQFDKESLPMKKALEKFHAMLTRLPGDSGLGTVLLKNGWIPQLERLFALSGRNDKFNASRLSKWLKIPEEKLVIWFEKRREIIPGKVPEVMTLEEKQSFLNKVHFYFYDAVPRSTRKVLAEYLKLPFQEVNDIMEKRLLETKTNPSCYGFQHRKWCKERRLEATKQGLKQLSL